MNSYQTLEVEVQSLVANYDEETPGVKEVCEGLLKRLDNLKVSLPQYPWNALIDAVKGVRPVLLKAQNDILSEKRKRQFADLMRAREREAESYALAGKASHRLSKSLSQQLSDMFKSGF